MSDTEVADLMNWCERDPFPAVSRRRKGVRVTTAAAAALGLSLGGRWGAGATSHSTAGTAGTAGTEASNPAVGSRVRAGPSSAA